MKITAEIGGLVTSILCLQAIGWDDYACNENNLEYGKRSSDPV